MFRNYKKNEEKNVFYFDYSIESFETEMIDNAFEKVNIKFSKENDIPFSVFKPTSLGSYNLFKWSSKEILNDNENLIGLILKRFDRIFEYAKNESQNPS